MDEEQPHTNGNSNSNANGNAEGFDGEAKIGDVLERARKGRGLSLQEVEQDTKIRKRYLAGLEQEDYSLLPDSVYVQGFLKTYANYLGLDGEELSRDLKRRRGRRRDQRQVNVGEIKNSGFDRPVLGPGGLSEAQGSRISPATLLTLIIAVVALGTVIGALYYVGRDTQTVGSPGSSPPSAEQAAPASDGQEGGSERGSDGNEPEVGEEGRGNQAGVSGGANEEEAVIPAADTLAVTVSVEGAESWVSVSADGAIAYEQIAPVGFSQTFESEEDITLSTGNAGALEVEVNGQDLGPVGEDGEVVLDRSFTLKDAS